MPERFRIMTSDSIMSSSNVSVIHLEIALRAQRILGNNRIITCMTLNMNEFLLDYCTHVLVPYCSSPSSNGRVDM
jgi:hypothetical protein